MDNTLLYLGKIVIGGKKRDRVYYSVWIGNKEKLKPLLGKKVLVIILPIEE